MSGIKHRMLRSFFLLFMIPVIIFSSMSFVQASDFPPFLLEEMKKDGGDCGRLIIPDLFISVALYDIKNHDASYGQIITDNEDSAAWCNNRAYYGHPCRIAIADHNYQGFERISGAVPGTTKAFLVKDGILTEYLCKAKYSGYNRRDYVSDVYGRDIIEKNSNDLIVYTCKFGWEVIDVIELIVD